MRSFRHKHDPRRKTYLALVGSIESQLRDAFARQNQKKNVTQSSLAERLNINRSAVHKRLTGRTNMRLNTLADVVWALDQLIEVKIYDRGNDPQKNFFIPEISTAQSKGDVSQLSAAPRTVAHSAKTEFFVEDRKQLELAQ